MEDKNFAILLSNAGIIVVHNGIRILIDGLYKDLGGNFSQLPDWAWNTMQQGKGELGNIDYLLFTHSHYDHYYAPYVNQYLEKNQVKGVLFPPVDDTKGLEEQVQMYEDKKITLDAAGCATLESDITLRIMTTRHVDERFHHVPNQCISLEIGGQKLAFLADADCYESDFQAAKDFVADIVFVTPIFYNNAVGRRILREQIHAKTIVMYHLPSPEDDRFMYHKMAVQGAKRHALPDEETLIWNESGQRIAF
ncbi:MBL fold metallo-hydrolase [Chakrabartyella piscis]|uniref:MBL fold metallo-hydrolase n=1 Tax=Chakrabartyella piscis TaxID=2918914 RepID=UPI0029583DFF|nr:MBL fold metallo-hydrolase [Chakrabartyella piscis]